MMQADLFCSLNLAQGIPIIITRHKKWSVCLGVVGYKKNFLLGALSSVPPYYPPHPPLHAPVSKLERSRWSVPIPGRSGPTCGPAQKTQRGIHSGPLLVIFRIRKRKASSFIMPAEGARRLIAPLIS